MKAELMGVVSLGELGEYLDSVVNNFYGAARLLLLPAIMNIRVISCESLRRFCCDGYSFTVNYSVGGIAIVRAELGSLRRGFVPCAVDTHRMPPLRRFVESGILHIVNGSLMVNYWDDYLKLIESTSTTRGILTVLQALSECGVFSVGSLSRCLGLEPDVTYYLLLMARILYPAVLELIMPNGKTINSMLRELDVSTVIDADEVMGRLLSVRADEVIISPSPIINNILIALPKVRPRRKHTSVGVSGRGVNTVSFGDGFVSVRSAITRHSIPTLLDLVNFRGVVADIGCGFGIKGTYGLRRGASYVILMDIDERVLRLRRSGWAVDLIVADARKLPLRDSSIDVTILWNVVNFVREKYDVISEVRRVCRGEVAFSVYNAANAYWEYTYEDFLGDVLMIGRPRIVRRVGGTQYQAIVRVGYGEHKD
jgi:hypothetical protein